MQDEISAKLGETLEAESVNVMFEGNRAHIEVTSAKFIGMNRVQKQQAVYACIQEYIADGRLHAVTIKADVPGGD